MRAALVAVALAAAGAARAGTPLAVAERQVVTLEFDRPVARLAVTDPEVVALERAGVRVKLTAARAGRCSVEVAFEDGATVTYDVVVAPALRAAARAPGPGELELGVGEARTLPAAGIAHVLLEENGIARVEAQRDTVRVVGLARGTASLVLVDGAGARTTWSVRVR